jgi:hypothetical protein
MTVWPAGKPLPSEGEAAYNGGSWFSLDNAVRVVASASFAGFLAGLYTCRDLTVVPSPADQQFGPPCQFIPQTIPSCPSTSCEPG